MAFRQVTQVVAHKQNQCNGSDGEAHQCNAVMSQVHHSLGHARQSQLDGCLRSVRWVSVCNHEKSFRGAHALSRAGYQVTCLVDRKNAG